MQYLGHIALDLLVNIGVSVRGIAADTNRSETAIRNYLSRKKALRSQKNWAA